MYLCWLYHNVILLKSYRIRNDCRHRENENKIFTSRTNVSTHWKIDENHQNIDVPNTKMSCIINSNTVKPVKRDRKNMGQKWKTWNHSHVFLAITFRRFYCRLARIQRFFLCLSFGIRSHYPRIFIIANSCMVFFVMFLFFFHSILMIQFHTFFVKNVWIFWGD